MKKYVYVYIHDCVLSEKSIYEFLNSTLTMNGMKKGVFLYEC